MCITDSKYGTAWCPFSLILQPRATPYCARVSLLCVRVPTVHSYRTQVLAVLLLCFPCGQIEQRRQMGSWETPQVLTEQCCSGISFRKADQFYLR